MESVTRDWHRYIEKYTPEHLAYSHTDTALRDLKLHCEPFEILVIVNVGVDRFPNLGCTFLAEFLAPLFIFFLDCLWFLLHYRVSFSRIKSIGLTIGWQNRKDCNEWG